jgi:hypothetical protein
MSTEERKIFLRGITAARSILKRIGCPEKPCNALLIFQGELATAWGLDYPDEASIERETAAHIATVEEVNEALATIHPDWKHRSGRTEKERKQPQ